MSCVVAETPARAPLQRNLTARIASTIENTEPEAGLTQRELARIAYGVEDPTAAQLSAVRRSVARLVGQDRADRGKTRHRPYGTPGRAEREIHRPLTDTERQAKRHRQELAVSWLTERREAESKSTPYPVDTGYGGIIEVPVEPVLKITEGGVELREIVA